MIDTTRNVEYDGVFQIEPCTNAAELLSHLRLSNGRWNIMIHENDPWYRPWIFRGQRDESWPLLPPTWRPLEKDELANKLFKKIFLFSMERNLQPFLTQLEKQLEADKQAYIPTLKLGFLSRFSMKKRETLERLAITIVQMVSETLATWRFCELADKYGYPIPGSLQAIKTLHFNLLHTNTVELGTELLESNKAAMTWGEPYFAFAQHHGIPTRLLDWTRRPEYAAFFAAEEIVKHKISTGNLAIYALCTHPLTLSDPTRFRVVQVPKGENEYLKSQDGLFLLDSEGDAEFVATGIYPDMKVALRSVNAQHQLRPVKFTLPVGEAENLLRLLFLDYGVTRASLMPTLDNVSDSIKLELLLRMS